MLTVCVVAAWCGNHVMIVYVDMDGFLWTEH